MNVRTKYISHLIRDCIIGIDPQSEVILYGSRARGDETSESDWDILILTNYPVDRSIEKMFRDKLYDLELETGEVFSVLVFSKHNWTNVQKITPFYENVTEEGILL